ncbi:MAG: YggS family pyridoxal phosphate-dependent enzyme [Syntrophomonadaceae bacterium]|nr:YggS family pyridoxal phosphate-dependent enzyme [Syntrophomonadaceae bacterium]
MNSFKHNYEQVTKNIRNAAIDAGRDPSTIGLIAVSKSIDDDALALAIKLGMRDFGENRAPELVRRSKMHPGLRWHMIGQLQSNKVKNLIGCSCLIHSLDRWALAEEIEAQSARQNAITSVLVEVNVAGEKQKAGLAPDDLAMFLESVAPMRHLDVCGLMCMAPLSDRADDSREVFRWLHERFIYFGRHSLPGVRMKWLSMGMSQDYTVAVEEGANLLRVGSALFDEG